MFCNKHGVEGAHLCLHQLLFTNKQLNTMENTEHNSTENFKIKGDWTKQSKEMQSKFPSLTDSDLKLEDGKENEMLNRVETRLNKNRDEVINIIRKGQPATV